MTWLARLVSLASAVALVALAGLVGCGGKIFVEPDEAGAQQLGADADVDGSIAADADADAAADAPRDAVTVDVYDGGLPPGCGFDAPDEKGCPCPNPGAMRACYSGPLITRHVGSCSDGTQSCGADGKWGPCLNEVLPQPENCRGTGTTDYNCNGLTGCADPHCATAPVCMTTCTGGQSRSCYDGPDGTQNVGVCHAGTQTCAGTTWGPCVGEVVPTKEQCCDGLDDDCNGIAGCYDTASCYYAGCCKSGPCSQGTPDPGCECPANGTCPQGKHIHHQTGAAGGGSGIDECCPCTASDCGTGEDCCAEPGCAGTSSCATFVCAPLDPACGGRVYTSCDTDTHCGEELCCECRNWACQPDYGGG